MQQTEKRKRSKEEVLEIVVAVFLGITALATAWASWIGSLHGGNQATNYTSSNNYAAQGNSMYNEAAQKLMQDMILWNDISDVRIDYAFAQETNNTEEMDKLAWKQEQLYVDNCSDEMMDAINWADAQGDASPFDKEGFVDSYFEDAYATLDESQALLEQGKMDNANGDAFGLVTVIYSVILFMLGIAGTFKNLPNRILIVAIAIVGFVIGTIYMFTIPLPTGFNLLSYF